VPGGALGGLRVVAFVAVTIGAVLLARPEKPSERRTDPVAARALTERS
jgi:hypothetical protein